jgi:RimJ/RimL family protein N-acetyltransferase
LAVAYAFEDLRIDTIHGVQVIDNIAARNFSMRLGFKPVAVVPDYHAIDGKLVAAQVMMLRKADFWPGCVAWKEKQPKVGE